MRSVCTNAQGGADLRVSILTGLDVSASDGFAALKGKSIGVLCHHASVDRHFRHITRLLTDAQKESGFQMKCAFSPEHGLWGAKDSRIPGTNIDSRTGLTVHSLYGETYRPTKPMLEGIETLIIDLQDVGARFYTYTWTMAHCLSACEEFGVQAVVLDRPNPIGGELAEGTVLEPKFSSFVGLHPVAQRHGMTFGEMATWIKDKFHPKLDLKVIEMQGWSRKLLFERTDLPWISPSPNMPRVDTAYVYPGMCLLEGTALSEGRGTTRPFETFGHPKLDGWKLVSKLSGIPLRPLYYQPTWSKHAGQYCGGAFLIIKDRFKFRPVETAIRILLAVRELVPEALGWEEESRRSRFDRLAGCSWLRESIASGEKIDAIQQRSQEGSKQFLIERKESLLYD